MKSMLWIRTAVFLLVVGPFGGLLMVQAASATDTSDANQRAQAEFYSQQAKTLAARQGRSLAERLLEDDAGAAAASLTVIVAIFSLLFNAAQSREQDRTTQLSEAQRRFGDRDSAALRASAATTLAVLGRPSPVMRVIGRAFRWHATPNFYTALEQLRIGILIEPDPSVVDAIAAALRQLSWFYPAVVVRSLEHIAYPRDLAERIAVVAAQGEEGTTVVARLLHWNVESLRAFIEQRSERVAVTQELYRRLGRTEQLQELRDAYRSLRVASLRRALIVDLLKHLSSVAPQPARPLHRAPSQGLS
jgi:hypothetical protein